MTSDVLPRPDGTGPDGTGPAGAGPAGRHWPVPSNLPYAFARGCRVRRCNICTTDCRRHVWSTLAGTAAVLSSPVAHAPNSQLQSLGLEPTHALHCIALAISPFCKRPTRMQRSASMRARLRAWLSCARARQRGVSYRERSGIPGKYNCMPRGVRRAACHVGMRHDRARSAFLSTPHCCVGKRRTWAVRPSLACAAGAQERCLCHRIQQPVWRQNHHR